MAIGFLKTIAQRIAQPFVSLSVRLRKTVGRTMQAIGRAGIDIEAGALREQIRRTTAIREGTERIIGMERNRVVDPLNIPEAVTRQRRQFAWSMRIEHIDANTGEVTNRYLTISTDELLSPAEAMAMGEEMALEDYKIRHSTITQTEITGVTRAGRPGVL